MKKEVSVLFMLSGILFASCLLISNILATKILMIGPWAAPAGVLIFPITYILNDVITEVWGFSKARLIIWSGFAINLIAVLFFTVGIAVPGAPFWQGQEAFQTVLGNTPRIAVASLCAYLAGSFLNAFIMSKMKVKTNGKGFSTRAILSTLFGESADSIIFITIAFAGIFPVGVLATMILTQAMIKTVYEILVLPLTLFVVKHIKRVENTDTFDTDLSYNPFKLNEI
jgi:queuosine precursor transporter